MTDTYSRTLSIATVPNLRDLGGIPSEDRAVRRGVVYRSATLAALSTADEVRFAELGIRTVYDLRTADEVAAAPDPLPSGTEGVNLDVLADSATNVAASLGRLATDPDAFVASLSGGRAQRLFEESYRDFVRLPSALGAYRALYRSLLDPGRPGAALFHCTTGKDRTGWAAASLLTLVGVSTDDVYADYMQTNADLLPALEPQLREAEIHGVDRALLLPVVGVQESYLAAAFAQVEEQYGGIVNYAYDGLGLSAADHRRLQDLLLG